MSQSLRAQDGGRSRHAERGASNVHSAGSSRVREAIAFNAELADKSTWLWLRLERMGFPLKLIGGGEHEERAGDLDSNQRARDRLVAYHLAPAITDFIWNEDQEC